MSESVMQQNGLDKAFSSMIEKSEQILAYGRPEKKFVELLPRPAPEIRVECDFELVEELEAQVTEISPQQFAVYHPLVEELKRFEPQTVLFTALEPGQGVTYTAHNIARLWSDDPLKKTLLLELYNGMSGIKYRLPLLEARTLAENPQSLESHLRYSSEADLYYLSAHVPGAGNLTGEVWNRLKVSFESIIIDCGPFWHNVLAARLAPLCDGTVMIGTRRPQPEMIRRFTGHLQQINARFMGVLLNAQ